MNYMVVSQFETKEEALEFERKAKENGIPSYSESFQEFTQGEELLTIKRILKELGFKATERNKILEHHSNLLLSMFLDIPDNRDSEFKKEVQEHLQYFKDFLQK